VVDQVLLLIPCGVHSDGTSEPISAYQVAVVCPGLLLFLSDATKIRGGIPEANGLTLLSGAVSRCCGFPCEASLTPKAPTVISYLGLVLIIN
jgi:hypothetical protein